MAEVWALQARHKAFAARVYDAWRALGLDAVICPAGVMPATKNGAAAVADRSIDRSLPLSLHDEEWRLRFCERRGGVLRMVTCRVTPRNAT